MKSMGTGPPAIRPRIEQDLHGKKKCIAHDEKKRITPKFRVIQLVTSEMTSNPEPEIPVSRYWNLDIWILWTVQCSTKCINNCQDGTIHSKLHLTVPQAKIGCSRSS